MKHYYEVKFTTGDYLYIKTDSCLQDIQLCIKDKTPIVVEALLSSQTSEEALIGGENIMYIIERKSNPHLGI